MRRDLDVNPPSNRRYSINPGTGSVRWTATHSATLGPLPSSPVFHTSPVPTTSFSSISEPLSWTPPILPHITTSDRPRPRARRRRSRSLVGVHVVKPAEESGTTDADEYRAWLRQASAQRRGDLDEEEEERSARQYALASLRSASPTTTMGASEWAGGGRLKRSRSAVGERVARWLDPGPWGEVFEKERLMQQPGGRPSRDGRSDDDPPVARGRAPAFPSGPQRPAYGRAQQSSIWNEPLPTPRPHTQVEVVDGIEFEMGEPLHSAHLTLPSDGAERQWIPFTPEPSQHPARQSTVGLAFTADSPISPQMVQLHGRPFF